MNWELIITIVSVVFVVLFLGTMWACCRMAGICSREEERRWGQGR